MPCVLTTEIKEGTSFGYRNVFTDRAGDSVVPTSIKWSLTDNGGNIINSRNDVVVTPAASVEITIDGTDTLALEGVENERHFTIKAIYDSTEGSDLPLNDGASFLIIPLGNVPTIVP